MTEIEHEGFRVGAASHQTVWRGKPARTVTVVVSVGDRFVFRRLQSTLLRSDEEAEELAIAAVCFELGLMLAEQEEREGNN